MTRLVLAVWLVVVWVALWGDLSIANVLSGVLVAAVLLVVFPASGEILPQYRARPLAALRLVGYFLLKMAESNWSLARMVLSRDDQIRTGVIAVPLVCDSDGLLTIVANLTALTPGMMVLEVERQPARFYVHVLQLDDVDAARSEIMELERRVVEAFGSPEAVAAVRTAAARRHEVSA